MYMWMVLAALLSLPGAGASVKENMQDTPLIVAHRGASDRAPENTISAFTEAFRRGADMIEGDFRITADGQVVCIHDATTGRTTGNAHDLVVRDSVLSQLRHLDVGVWKGTEFEGERIPTLQEVLAILPEEKGLVIELKGGDSIARPSAEIVMGSGIDPARITFIAFDQATLAAVKRGAPACRALFLSDFTKDKATGEWTPTADTLIDTARRLKADGLDVKANPDVLDKAFVDRVHNAGLSLHVYTVDDPDLARRLMEVGVDSITTNRPGRTRAALGSDG